MEYRDSQWSRKTLEEIWNDVQNILEEKGDTYNYKLKDELDPADYGGRGLTSNSLERALVDLRQIKDKEGAIETDSASGEGNRDRKLWKVVDE